MRGSDNARCLLQILDVGPRHGLEIAGEPERRAEFAERGEALGQPRRLGIVAGDQDVLGAQPRPGFEHR
jgi:hypothetical protein